jgi:hypothetical protein
MTLQLHDIFRNTDSILIQTTKPSYNLSVRLRSSLFVQFFGLKLVPVKKVDNEIVQLLISRRGEYDVVN